MLAKIVAVLIVCLCLYEFYARYRARNLPPGISGLLCLLEIPKEKPWLELLQFSQKYGEIASLSFCGYNIIIIGSARIARDLLDKRGINYADRPRSVMGGELAGWNKMMTLCNHTDWFRNQRKWIAHDIGSHAAVSKFHEIIEAETRRALQSVLDDPDRLWVQIRKHFVSIASRLSHGYVTGEGDDPLVEIIGSANTQLSRAITVGANYVDVMPFLKYIPKWVPGVGFKKKAVEYAAVTHDALEIPHNYAMSQLTAGTELPSLSSRLLSMPGLTEEMEDEVKWATLTMLRGGVDTSASTAYSLYLAMTLHPHVMVKAQQELDSVVGTARLPTFADRPSLPYLEALFTELLRWHASGPITMRRTTADDVYNGYEIPAGSYLLVNMWAMLRDESMYKDPLEFKPERFFGDEPEPHPSAAFGFGRRRCPGIFLAHSTVWLLCAQSLAVFDISKYVENGVEITPELNQVGGTFLYVAPFKCSIKPRSEAAKHLIKTAFPM